MIYNKQFKLVSMRKREKREREREIERERENDRQRKRQRDRHTDREAESARLVDRSNIVELCISLRLGRSLVALCCALSCFQRLL